MARCLLVAASAIDYAALRMMWVNRMALNIKNRETERLPHDLAQPTGERSPTR